MSKRLYILSRLTIIALITVLAPSISIAQTETGTISGVVSDQNDQPLAHVNVGVLGNGHGAATNEQGQFIISNLKAGSYVLGATIIGYDEATIEVEVRTGETTEVRFKLRDALYEMPQVNILAQREGIFETVPGALTYIDRKEIDRISPVSGNEVLRRSPGVHVVDEEGAGMRLNLGIRGLNPDRSRSVLVMEDGIPVALSPYGEPELYYTPSMDRMEGVEILRGSGSILYGPQTIGGVVNYITADPPEGQEGSINMRGGQGGFFSGNMFYGQTKGKAGFTVNYHRRQADDLGPTQFRINDLTSKFKLQINKRSNLGVKLGVYDETSNSTYVGITQTMYDAGGQDFERIAPFDVLNVRRYSVSATHNYLVSKRTKITTTAFGYTTTRNWQRQDFAYNSFDAEGNLNPPPGNFSGVVWGDESVAGGAIYMRNGTGNRNRSFGVAGVESRLTSNFNLGKLDNEFTAGARFIYERAFEQRINGSKPDASSGMLREDEIRTGYGTSAYVHNRFKLSKRFSVTAGTRIEHFDYMRDIRRRPFNGVVTDTSLVTSSALVQVIPGAGFNLQVSNKYAIFGGLHRGFAPPRIKDAISGEGEAYELDAERSWNYELGFRSQPFRGVQLDVTGFFMDFSNQVIPVSESSGGLGLVVAGVVNGGATQHLGVEGLIAFNFGEMARWEKFNVLFDANVTWVQATFSEDRFKQQAGQDVNIAGNRTPYAPELLISSALTLEHHSGLALRTTLTHVGSQFGDELNTVEPSANGRIGLIDAYTLIDVNLFYHLAKINTTFNISVKNITDERYIVSRRPQGIRVGLPRFITAGFKFGF